MNSDMNDGWIDVFMNGQSDWFLLGVWYSYMEEWMADAVYLCAYVCIAVLLRYWRSTAYRSQFHSLETVRVVRRRLTNWWSSSPAIPGASKTCTISFLLFPYTHNVNNAHHINITYYTTMQMLCSLIVIHDVCGTHLSHFLNIRMHKVNLSGGF